jgi:D-tyrosyl-tRNA(Tyr) deacylase
MASFSPGLIIYAGIILRMLGRMPLAMSEKTRISTPAVFDPTQGMIEAQTRALKGSDFTSRHTSTSVVSYVTGHYVGNFT